jgi:DNA-binding transcriptional MerR regulator
MLIGELSRRTGVSERLLRYYERAELIASQRRPNGYRDYDDGAVETVRRIRALLAAGLPTRTIRQILPCTSREGLQACPGVVASLRERLDTLDQRADELAEARGLLRQTIATLTEPKAG